jgi:hypothetical protein
MYKHRATQNCSRTKKCEIANVLCKLKITARDRTRFDVAYRQLPYELLSAIAAAQTHNEKRRERIPAQTLHAQIEP